MSAKVLDDNGNPFTSYFTNLQAVTVSATTTVSFAHKAVFVGTAGNLAVQMTAGGSEIVLTCPAGAWLPIQIYSVNSTATTASNIVVAR